MARNSSFGIFKILLLLIATVIAADAALKFFTNYYLPPMGRSSFYYPYGGIPVFKNFLGIEFSISHATNTGAAWGVFSQYQHFLLGLRIALILCLAGYMVFFRKLLQQQICLALIIAGALGNVLDYFLYGHVVDMLHFVLFGYDFPVFNLADTAIFFGVSGYLLTSTGLAKTA